MCAKSVWAGRKHLGIWKVFLKNLYIYKCKWVCVVRKKKRTKLAFSKRKKHSARRGKTKSSKENFSIQKC